jgi:hypothetical protein
LKKLALAAVVSGATFFVLSPFVVLELPMALDHMRANRQVVMDRSLDAGSMLFPSLPAYTKFLADQGLGYLLLGLVIVGWILMAGSGTRRLVLWGVFPLLFFALLAYTFFAGRYLNPLAPSLAAAAGVAIGTIHRRWGRAAAILVTLAACAQPLYNDIEVDRLFAGTDTRTLARQWILDHVPDGHALALQSYSVPIPQSIGSFRESLEANSALDQLERRGKFSHLADVAERNDPAYRLFFLGRGEEKGRIYFDYREMTKERLEPLRERGVGKIVLRHAPEEPPPEVREFFRVVREQGQLLVRISPFRADAPGLHPYMDNEDWPARRHLSHKGPLVEVWSLEQH